jgi:hypothetical protein
MFGLVFSAAAPPNGGLMSRRHKFVGRNRCGYAAISTELAPELVPERPRLCQRRLFRVGMVGSWLFLYRGRRWSGVRTTDSFSRDGWFIGGGVENNLDIFGIAAPGWFMK